MSRTLLTVAVVLVAPAVSRAEILPSFDVDDCAKRATHILVVNEKGVVLESWRGDLKPGDHVPLDEFKVKLEQDVGDPFRMNKADLPKKVTGKRLVMFLKRGGSKYGNGQEAGSWGAAHWFGWFNASMAWIEDGQAFGLMQWVNPGDQVMSHVGTEDELKKHVAKVSKTAADEFAKARAEKNLGKRAEILGEVVQRYPGFAVEALAGLEWCGVDALPALRTLVGKEFIANSERLGAYAVMTKIGAPGRDEFMKPMSWLLSGFKDRLDRIEYDAEHRLGLDVDSRNGQQLLLVLTANPDAFDKLTDEQVKTLRELRDLWATHKVLSNLGEKGDRVHDRLDRILAKKPR